MVALGFESSNVECDKTERLNSYEPQKVRFSPQLAIEPYQSTLHCVVQQQPLKQSQCVKINAKVPHTALHLDKRNA